jgi:predicted metal-dependent enzyme (double-stranded beta helix superfamily)
MILQELILHITNAVSRKSDIGKIRSIVEQYDGDDWKSYVKVDVKRFSKINIYTDPDQLFDVKIITWNKKQKSCIHNHSRHGCILKVLQGTLMEYQFKCDDCATPNKTTSLQANDVGYIHDDIGYHCISNESNGVAVSLHIYKPANFCATVSKKYTRDQSLRCNQTNDS